MKKSLCFVFGFVYIFVLQDVSEPTQSMISKTSRDSLRSLESAKGIFPNETDKKAGFDIRIKHEGSELRFEGFRICKGISIAWITEEGVSAGLVEPEHRITEPMRALIEAWLNLKISGASLAMLKNSDPDFVK
jgi:hypothetical protein